MGNATLELVLTVVVIFRRPRFDALARRARPAIDRAQGRWYGAALIAAFGIYLIYRGLQG
jgi:hypothetical protein